MFSEIPFILFITTGKEYRKGAPMIRLIMAISSESLNFKPFSAPYPHFLDISTTHSTCIVHGNISTGCTDTGSNRPARTFKSRARVAGLHDT